MVVVVSMPTSLKRLFKPSDTIPHFLPPSSLRDIQCASSGITRSSNSRSASLTHLHPFTSNLETAQSSSSFRVWRTVMQWLQFSKPTINEDELGIPVDTARNDDPHKHVNYDDVTGASASQCSSSYVLMPPLRPENHGKKTLVLDLDETLVHSSFKPTSAYDFIIRVEVDSKMQTAYVLKRPGVDQFLLAMAKKFELVIFTAGLKSYADPLLNKLDPYSIITYRLYRESCKQHGGGLVKDLSLLGRDLQKVIIVDNSPHSYLLHPDNAIPISSFTNNLEDRELLDLIPLLSVIAELDNVLDALGKHQIMDVNENSKRNLRP